MRKVKEFLKNNLRILILLLVILLAAFLRFYRINDNPPSLNWDEVSHGYNAYSIIKTGKDEWGTKFPLIFRAYGDYKLPLYIYATTPLVGLLGLNVFSVRLISILSGIGLVAVTYFLTRKITKNEPLSLFAAFLTAVSPWSLFVSRAALEANLAAFLFAAGGYCLLSWVENNRKLFLIGAATSWGLSLYAYNSARVMVPLFVLMTTLLVWKKKAWKEALLAALLLLIFSLPLLGQFFDQTAKARFTTVSLIDQGAVDRIIEKRNQSFLPKSIVRAVYNRPTFFAFYATKNYLANLSPVYLFFRGGNHYQFSLPDHELLYLVSAPFLLLGMIKALKTRGTAAKLVVAWFFLAIVPSAITRDAPHVLRTILILPTPMILTALGVEWVAGSVGEKSLFRGRLLIGVLTLSVFISFAKWWSDYWQIYPAAYSWAWQYGYKEVATFLKDNYADYQKIFVTKRYGEPHEFLAFYWPWDPKTFQEPSVKEWDYHADWYWVNKLEKVSFVNDWEVKYQVACGTREKCLLITSPNNYPKGWRKIKTVNFLDREVAFEILEQ
jgi:4-amino-4-deoxy-L-arabinose transferase-like glycosyltransferase